MSEQRYDIYFRGECLDGFDDNQVKQGIAKLFKATPDKVQVLFSGKVVALKKGLDKATAIKFKQALEKAGARIYIKAAAGSQPAAQAKDSTRPAAKPEQPSQPAASGELGVLPTGSDVLTPEERRQYEELDLDLSHIQLQSAFAPVENETTPAPPPPDVSHLSAAEPGSDILEGYQNDDIPLSEPDTSYLSMAEVGADLQELADAMNDESIPLPDTDYITIAEPGADIDPAEKEPAPPPPDVSHISISDPN